MKVNINIPVAQPGQFSRIELGYIVSEEHSVNAPLNIDFRNLYEFTGENRGLTFDIFLLGSLVYGIDLLLPRNVYSENGWCRNIEVEFPIEFPEIFNHGKDELEHLLSFLTGDNWSISFTKRDDIPLYIKKERSKNHSQEYRNSFEKVSLFSGGLDSLIGVINELSNSDEKMVLVSHYDGTSFKGSMSDQKKLNKILFQKYGSQYQLLQTRVDMARLDTNGAKMNKESTLRSRSFMFLCQAIFVSHSIKEDIEVLIPENGTISLNHPLNPSRRSSCSTRTAHPYYLLKVEEFIRKLGLNHSIKNDYQKRTKGEMMKGCIDSDVLIETYKHSCSCAKRGTRKDIRDIKEGTNHCGICMPCIYRRVALHKIGLDDEIIGTDIFNPIKYPLMKLKGIPAFIDYMKQPLTIEDIEKNLLVNGTLPLDNISEYADVIQRTRLEIKEWIRDKGSSEIKKMLNIR